MNTYGLYALVVAIMVLWPSAAMPDDPVRVDDLNNIRVRFIAAKKSESRGQNLIAKFETQDKDRKEFVIVFPSHSFTTHESTLMSIVGTCSGREVDNSGWTKAKSGVEAVYSIPVGGVKDYSMLEQCYLVTLVINDKN